MKAKPGAVTIERLERALLTCARIVVLDGPAVLPIFERLERELEAARRDRDAVARAVEMTRRPPS